VRVGVEGGETGSVRSQPDGRSAWDFECPLELIRRGDRHDCTCVGMRGGGRRPVHGAWSRNLAGGVPETYLNRV
jgi:hypothetical protein